MGQLCPQLWCRERHASSCKRTQCHWDRRVFLRAPFSLVKLIGSMESIVKCRVIDMDFIRIQVRLVRSFQDPCDPLSMAAGLRDGACVTRLTEASILSMAPFNALGIPYCHTGSSEPTLIPSLIVERHSFPPPHTPRRLRRARRPWTRPPATDT